MLTPLCFGLLSEIFSSEILQNELNFANHDWTFCQYNVQVPLVQNRLFDNFLVEYINVLANVC